MDLVRRKKIGLVCCIPNASRCLCVNQGQVGGGCSRWRAFDTPNKARWEVDAAGGGFFRAAEALPLPQQLEEVGLHVPCPRSHGVAGLAT